MPLRSPLTTRLRVARIWAATARILLSYLWLRAQRRFLTTDRYAAKLKRRHIINARRIERAIVRAGGLFIKVGQLISILTNFLPEEFRKELEGLQDQLPPRPYEEVAARIEADFGQRPDELFIDFNPVPIATASLAQVHVAKLADGTVVAVKAQHADIERVAALDLVLIWRLMRLVQWITGFRGLEAYHPEVSAMIAEELDFTTEARHIETIGARLAIDPTVRCPVVVHARSTRRVLTTEFVRGTKIIDFASLAAQGFDRRRLAERIVTAYCKMIFVDGVYHADPHPGNILVAPDGALVFIDFGAVGTLAPRMKQGVIDFVEGVVRGDSVRIADAMRTMGFVARGASADDVAKRIIKHAQRRFLDEISANSFTLGSIQIDPTVQLDALADLRGIGISFRQLTQTFQVPKSWVLLERTLLLLLGLCTELDPTWNPMTVIRPYLEDVVVDENRNWTEMISGSLKNVAVSAAGIPATLQTVLTTADRGELEIRVPEIMRASRMLYAAAHQLIYSIFTVTSGIIAYQAYDRGHTTLGVVLAIVAAMSILALFGSIAGARRYGAS